MKKQTHNSTMPKTQKKLLLKRFIGKEARDATYLSGKRPWELRTHAHAVQWPSGVALLLLKLIGKL